MLTAEQKKACAKAAREMATEIDEGRFIGTPTNRHSWCGCAAGLLLRRAGLPAVPYGNWLDGLVNDDLSMKTQAIDGDEGSVCDLAPVYRALADALEESAAPAAAPEAQ